VQSFGFYKYIVQDKNFSSVNGKTEIVGGDIFIAAPIQNGSACIKTS
jgi:hypothetical protein